MNDDYNDEQTDICYNQAVMEWWYGCWGDQCGTNLPEGICYEKCTTKLEECGHLTYQLTRRGLHLLQVDIEDFFT